MKGNRVNKNVIYETFGEDALKMGLVLLEESGAAALLQPGMRVGIKPNLVVAKPASSGATTHAGFAEAAVRFVREHGVSDVVILESAWVGEGTQRAFAATGYFELAQKLGVELFDVKRDTYDKVRVDGHTVEISHKALSCDILINLPVLKAHCQTRLTCALKNLKGLISDKEKRRYHADGLHQPIALLGAALKPAITLVDGICGDLTFEEGGTPVPMHRAFLSFDAVLVDTYAASLLCLSPEEVAYIGMAEALGAGSSRLSGEMIRRVGDTQAQPMPQAEGYRHIRRLTRNVQEKQACSACMGSLVHALHRLNAQNKPYAGGICIGQGFVGQAGEGLGIGKCCAGFAQSVPGCPPSARAIYESLRQTI